MVDRHPRVLVIPLYGSQPTQPPHKGDNKVKYWLNHLVVVIAAGKRPVSIPNLEAKPASADGTAPGRVWESRTPPQQPSRVGPGTQPFQAPPLFRITHTKHVLQEQARFVLSTLPASALKSGYD